MKTELEHILTNSYKTDLILYINNYPKEFEGLVKLIFSKNPKYAWRASWLLWSCMETNDKRLVEYIDRIIEILPYKSENQQRELLIILTRMDLTEENDVKLYNISVKIWENISKDLSVRYNAFKLILKIAKKHSELLNEIKLLTQPRYMDSLSETVKRCIFRMIKHL